MDEVLHSFLATHHITYELVKHKPVFTVADSESLPPFPGLRTKSLFLKDEQGKFYLVTLPGILRLAMPALRAHLKVKKLEFGSPEELKKELNTTPGSVSPCCLIHAQNVHALIHANVWDAEQVQCHPDSNAETLLLAQAQLRALWHALPGTKEVWNG